MSKPITLCSQCGDPILPGEVFLDEFMVGENAPVHEECGLLLILDQERANFWFDYQIDEVPVELTKSINPTG